MPTVSVKQVKLFYFYFYFSTLWMKRGKKKKSSSSFLNILSGKMLHSLRDLQDVGDLGSREIYSEILFIHLTNLQQKAFSVDFSICFSSQVPFSFSFFLLEEKQVSFYLHWLLQGFGLTPRCIDTNLQGGAVELMLPLAPTSC